MKKKMLAILLLVTMVFAMSVPTYAATKPGPAKKSYRFTYFKNKTYECWGQIPLKGFKSDMKVKNLKCSNTKVANVTWYDAVADGMDASFVSKDIEVQCKKAGSVKITGNIYKGSKKVNSFSVKVKIIKYKTPAKTFKVGSYSFTAKLKKRPRVRQKMEGTKKLKVSVKAAKGWKLKSMTLEYYDMTTYKDVIKKVKNGQTVKIDGTQSPTISATFYNKKQKLTQDVSVTLSAYE